MARDYPSTGDGTYVVGKNPIHTQVVINSGGKDYYIPVKSFTWDWGSANEPNLHSGSPLPSAIVDGHRSYKFTFETGTWVTDGVDPENAEKWEWLAYTHLVRPTDAGRPKPFTLIHKQSSYYDDGELNREAGDGEMVGAGPIMQFTGCKISSMKMSQGENGIIKRTYEGDALRMVYGSITPEYHAQ